MHPVCFLSEQKLLQCWFPSRGRNVAEDLAEGVGSTIHVTDIYTIAISVGHAIMANDDVWRAMVSVRTVWAEMLLANFCTSNLKID
ncbi:unnamed protein product [Urochloa humidicola]